jgi:hypothetical protein
VNEALHTPGAANLFSELVMAKKGFTITRTAAYTRYTAANGIPGPEAHLKNNMYVMCFRPISQIDYAANRYPSDLTLWHERCAHINVKYLSINSFEKLNESLR